MMGIIAKANAKPCQFSDGTSDNLELKGKQFMSYSVASIESSAKYTDAFRAKCLQSKLFADTLEIETRLAILCGEFSIKSCLNDMSVTTTKLHFADLEKRLEKILKSIKAEKIMSALDAHEAQSEPNLEAFITIKSDKKTRDIVAIILAYRKADEHFPGYTITVRTEHEDKLVSLAARLCAILQYPVVRKSVST